jgi:hypothetical protein
LLLPDPSIIKQYKSKKNLDFYCFVTSPYDFLSYFKIDVNVSSKSKKPKEFEEKNLFFVGILKATDEKSRIRTLSRIRIHKSVVLIPGL